MKEKFKNIIITILTFFKWLIIFIIHFILSLFSEEKRKQDIPKLKEIKKNETFNLNKIKKEPSTTLPNEEAPRQISETIFIWKLSQDEEDLKKYIKEIYLNILKIKEYQMNFKEEATLKLLQEVFIKEIKKDKYYLEIGEEAKFTEKLELDIKKKLEEWETVEYLKEDVSQISYSNKDLINEIFKVEESPVIHKKNAKSFNTQNKDKENNNNYDFFSNKMEFTVKKDEIQNKTNLSLNNPKEIINNNIYEEILENSKLLDQNNNIESEYFKKEEGLESEVEDLLIDNNLEQDKDKIEQNKPEDADIINLTPIENQIIKVENLKVELTEIPELEDKDYDTLLNKLEKLIQEKEILKQTKKLNNEDTIKLNKIEDRILKIKENVELEKNNDILNEEKLLNEDIKSEDLEILEQNLKQIHLNNKQILVDNGLNKLEDLNILAKDKSKIIEQKILKNELMQANEKLHIPFIKRLFSFHNKYFLYFTSARMVNRHLKIVDVTLKHTTLEYLPSDYSEIKKGADALEDAIILTTQNKEYLNYLEQQAFFKFPELRTDLEYMIILNELKANLRKNEEKLLKKKRMTEKYNLTKKYLLIKKLKRKKIA